MKCPDCVDAPLRSELTRQGVEVDRCGRCGGIWLDRGEIYYFTLCPRELEQAIDAAMEQARETEKRSPLSGTRLQEITLAPRLQVDVCPTTGGMWLQRGEPARVEKLRFSRPELDAGAAEAAEPTSDLPEPGVIPVPVQGLRPLPNLFLRSTLSLTALYALLIAVLIAAVEFAGLPLEVAMLIGIGIAAAQFTLGPWIMDFTLGHFFRMRWLEPRGLPPHLRRFADRVCREDDRRPARPPDPLLHLPDGDPIEQR
jgi:Zn-finger nucleic acid-binding protein